MARLVESGADVRQIAFSIASRSLPEGFAADTLVHESRAASEALGLPPRRSRCTTSRCARSRRCARRSSSC